MMATVDLTKLPEIEFVPQLTVEEIVDEALHYLATEEGIELEGAEDPAYRIVRSLAYRERIWRQDANESCRSLTLAYSTGDALDHIGITYYLTPRLDNESDDAYRARLALAPEGSSVAGPQNAYVFHGLSASPDVKAIDAEGPEYDLNGTSLEPINGVEAGQVRVTVLSHVGDGTPTDELLATVSAALNDEWVRPLTDTPIVQGATILPYAITATLFIEPLFEPSAVLAEAQGLAESYTTTEHRLGGRVVQSGVDQALHRPGVGKVELTGWQDVEAARNEAPYCTVITLTYEALT